ncbi:MAG: putative colanic acid biosynthesis acetyltransferase [Acidobacteriota bacterium]|nr:putative colanic acid biosynthesis acetyltransferase [Acidobacteriota bacterium]
MAERDPYLSASFSWSNRLRRALWQFAYLVLFRISPRPLHGWRRFVLRAFGARIGANCHIYSGARIWAPWNLHCEDVVAIADGAIVYNPALIFIGSHATISQEAYLCGATHLYEDPAFPLVSAGIHIGAHAWICARATVQPGIRVGEGAVLALASVATRDLEPWGVYGGIPARHLKERKVEERHHANAVQHG